MQLSLRFAAAAAFLVAVAAPIAFAMTPSAWVDDEYRLCMGDAIVEEMNQRVDAQRTYSVAQVSDLEQYRDALDRAWEVVDEDERRDVIRDADRAYRDAGRESKRAFDTRVREVKNASRDAQRACREGLNDHKSFVRNMCLSTADCRSKQVCTTEQGVCDPSCPGDVQSCAQVCAGTCERSTASRSSTSRSSSRSSTTTSGDRPWENYQSNGHVCRGSQECAAGYFCSTNLGQCNSSCAPGSMACAQVCSGTCLLFPINPPASSSSSSRSSTGGVQGTSCQPYRCADGRDVPSCTADGHPINYFQNPCYS